MLVIGLCLTTTTAAGTVLVPRWDVVASYVETTAGWRYEQSGTFSQILVCHGEWTELEAHLDPVPSTRLQSYSVDYSKSRLRVVDAGLDGSRVSLLACGGETTSEVEAEDAHDEWTTKSTLGWRLAPEQDAACTGDPSLPPVFLREPQARFRVDSGLGVDERLPFTGRIRIPYNGIGRTEAETGLLIAGTGPWTESKGRFGPFYLNTHYAPGPYDYCGRAEPPLKPIAGQATSDPVGHWRVRVEICRVSQCVEW